MGTESGARSARVFISYAHESDEHKEAVRQLWIMLRTEAGVDARLDIAAADRRRDWPVWMQQEATAADFVLVVASPTYRRRSEPGVAPDDGRGVQFEAALMRELVYSDPPTWVPKLLPVLLPGMTADDLPLWMSPHTCTTYRVTLFTVAGAEELIRTILRKPRHIEPVLGSEPNLPPATSPDSVPASVTNAAASAPSNAGFPTPIQAEAVSPLLPSTGPAVSNLPARDRLFTGRDDLVQQIHDGLRSVAALSTVTVHGLGGVGKTAVAVEYAHRFAHDYDVIWWTAAEQPATVATQLEKLAGRLGLATTDDGLVYLLLDHLRRRGRWLLIYDNVEDLDQLLDLLPTGGAGHVILTSRHAAGGGRTITVPIDVWPRAESVRFLIRRTAHTEAKSLNDLAELLGDLPLALEEAGAFLEETSEDLYGYVQMVRGHGRRLFHLTAPGPNTAQDRRSVATVWTLSMQRVAAQDPAAVPLLNVLAFLAPEVPRDLLSGKADVLPPELAAVIDDRLAYVHVLRVIGRYSLVNLSTDVVAMHRLVQAVVQARLTGAKEERWARPAIDVVRTSFPDESWEVSNWPQCERLLPHLLVVTAHAERLAICEAPTSWLLDRASTYMRKRGQYREAKPIAERALTATVAAAGPESSDTAWCHNNLGLVLHALRELDAAGQQFEQALRISESIGPDHPDAGVWRSNLGRVLRDRGDLIGARLQLEMALRISERALGSEDPTIGVRRGTLGGVLRLLGDLAGAKEQIEQGLRIGEAALGPDHLSLAVRRTTLGALLHEMGDLAGARKQFEDALRIGTRALGPDHPLVAARHSGLGAVLRDQGDYDGARSHFEEAVRIGELAYGTGDARVRTSRRHLDRLAELVPPDGRRPGDGDDAGVMLGE